MLGIPLINAPRQTLSVTLGAQNVDMIVWWQPLSEMWYLDVSIGNTRIALGRAMSTSVRLVDNFAFVGELAVLPLVGMDESEPGREAWDSTHRLVYLDAVETDAINWSV